MTERLGDTHLWQARYVGQQAQLQAQQELQKQVSPGPKSLREGASHMEVSNMGWTTDHHCRWLPAYCCISILLRDAGLYHTEGLALGQD